MKRTKLKGDDIGFDFGLEKKPGTGLSGRFAFPPFSVLRAMDGDWQRRKRQWLSLGIKSEVGRGGVETYESKKSYGIGKNNKVIDTKSGEKWEGGRDAWQNTGTSIFDPVLCELMYMWFCPPGGMIVDPFAGGSVRGIVAAYMGYSYWGSELRPEQVDANYEQKKEITPNENVEWVCGDANKVLKDAPDADFIFSCPPYGDLEVYSDLDGDISNLGYPDFKEVYQRIIQKACRRLKDDRFACFVVGNYRDKKTGMYHDLVGDTVNAFLSAPNMGYYNEAILVTAIGSLPVRITRQFLSGRKLGKTHQNILIFYKGDPSKIKDNFNTEQ